MKHHPVWRFRLTIGYIVAAVSAARSSSRCDKRRQSKEKESHG